MFKILMVYLTLLNSTYAKHNILFLVVDDLRPTIGIYGNTNAHTPNIDNFSKNSFVFKNAFCQQALCAPSRNSFLTSRRPDSLHLYDFYNYWRESVGNYTTLPQHFRNNNYFTYSIGKVFHPGISSNFTDDSKYSWSEQPFHPTTDIFKDAKVCVTSNGSLARNLVCPVIVNEQPRGILPDLESLNAALNFIRNADGITNSLPYFLAVGFHKPHIPLKFPLEYIKYHPINKVAMPKFRWRPSYLPSVAWNPWTDVRARDDINLLNISFPYGQIPDNVTRQIIQSYSAAVTYIDDIIGTLLSEIDKTTIVVLVGDNGWSMGEHGEFGKYSNYDTATRVPLIIRVPNMTSRTVFVNELVELVDIFPTLVDLTGISSSLETCNINKSNSILCTEGRSLVPLMISKLGFAKNSYKAKNAIFTQYPRPGIYPSEIPNSDEPRLKDIKIMGYSIRTKTNRYTEWVEFNATTCKPNWNNVFAKELYDHTYDRHENTNLANRNDLKSLMTELRRRLRLGWRYA